jgi:hypothetical protein
MTHETQPFGVFLFGLESDSPSVYTGDPGYLSTRPKVCMIEDGYIWTGDVMVSSVLLFFLFFLGAAAFLDGVALVATLSMPSSSPSPSRSQLARTRVNGMTRRHPDTYVPCHSKRKSTDV